MLVFGPVFLDKILFYTGLGFREIFAEKFPACVEHLINLDVHIDCKQSCRIFFCKIKSSEVIVAQVKTVFKFGLCILCI